jgi:hypothetical protein
MPRPNIGSFVEDIATQPKTRSCNVAMHLQRSALLQKIDQLVPYYIIVPAGAAKHSFRDG